MGLPSTSREGATGKLQNVSTNDRRRGAKQCVAPKKGEGKKKVEYYGGLRPAREKNTTERKEDKNRNLKTSSGRGWGGEYRKGGP